MMLFVGEFLDLGAAAESSSEVVLTGGAPVYFIDHELLHTPIVFYNKNMTSFYVSVTGIRIIAELSCICGSHRYIKRTLAHFN